MIIADGFDNTGKTTLALKLAHDFGLEYLHSPSEYRNDFSKMMDWAMIEMASQRLAIYDRFSPITDQVYGPVIRNSNPYGDTSKGRLIVELLKNTPHLIIYARPHRDRIIHFEDGREQMPGVMENAIKLLERYDQLMQNLQKNGWNIVGFNYEESGDYDYVQRVVKNHIKEMRMIK